MILFGNDMILYWDDMGVATMFDFVSIGFVCLLADGVSFVWQSGSESVGLARWVRGSMHTDPTREDQTGPDPGMSNEFHFGSSDIAMWSFCGSNVKYKFACSEMTWFCSVQHVSIRCSEMHQARDTR